MPKQLRLTKVAHTEQRRGCDGVQISEAAKTINRIYDAADQARRDAVADPAGERAAGRWPMSASKHLGSILGRENHDPDATELERKLDSIFGPRKAQSGVRFPDTFGGK